MWCINLSNLATWVLWILATIGSVGVICLIFATADRQYWGAKTRNRVQDNENDIARMRIDVSYLMKKDDGFVQGELYKKKGGK